MISTYLVHLASRGISHAEVRELLIFYAGHVLYEMAEGQSLETAVPTREEHSVRDSELAQVLDYIFHLKKPSKPEDAINHVSEV